MDRRYLTAVAPLPNHILQVDFVSGTRLLMSMAEREHNPQNI